jgi:hypothetical protein
LSEYPNGNLRGIQLAYFSEQKSADPHPLLFLSGDIVCELTNRADKTRMRHAQFSPPITSDRACSYKDFLIKRRKNPAI